MFAVEAVACGLRRPTLDDEPEHFQWLVEKRRGSERNGVGKGSCDLKDCIRLTTTEERRRNIPSHFFTSHSSGSTGYIQAANPL